MRKQIFALAGATALACAGFVGGALISSAEAQTAQKAPVILIVDRAQLLAQSKAGQMVPGQAETIRKGIEGELNAEGEKLQKEIENFQKNASLMSEEVRNKTEQDLAARAQYGMPQRYKIMEQALTAVVQNAQAEILEQTRPILKEIVDRRGATVLLDRSAVMYAAPETDITQEVLVALDKSFPKVEVQKISLAEVEKQLMEAAAKQQNAAAGNNKKK